MSAREKLEGLLPRALECYDDPKALQGLVEEARALLETMSDSEVEESLGYLLGLQAKLQAKVANLGKKVYSSVQQEYLDKNAKYVSLIVAAGFVDTEESNTLLDEMLAMKEGIDVVDMLELGEDLVTIYEPLTNRMREMGIMPNLYPSPKSIN